LHNTTECMLEGDWKCSSVIGPLYAYSIACAISCVQSPAQKGKCKERNVVCYKIYI
jgi:hypothetical protein